MADFFVLSEQDKAILQRLISREKQTVINTPSRPSGDLGWSEGEDHQANDVYIALTPSEGIPAREETEVGVASCELYRIHKAETTGLPTLIGIANLSRNIHNTATTSIDGDIYIPVTKTKIGKWVCTPPGGGFEKIRFTILSIDPDDGAAVVHIDARPCGMSKVSEESNRRVRVYDTLGCFFENEEDLELVGRQGYAVYMQATDPVDLAFVGTSTSTATGDNDAATGTGTDVFCQWEIDELCCPPLAECP